VNKQEYHEHMFGVCSAQEDVDVKQEYINSLEKQLFENKKCSNCLHYGLGQCLLYRECELSGGECGKGFVEIDNPDQHYCADYEDRIK